MASPPTSPSADGPRTTSLRGRSLVVTDDKPTFWDKAAAGAWEPELLAAFEAVVKPGDIVLDIGAWVGPTSLFSALLGAEVVSVEADPRAAALLSGNVAANPALSPHIRIVQRAASPVPGKLRLGAPRKPGDSMSSALHADRPNAWDVETIQPPALLAAAFSTGPGPLVVKIDIEGGEYELLPSLLAELPIHRVKAVIAAFHPRLLAESGRKQPDINMATRRCFSALEAWSARVLDVDSAEPPMAVASRINATVLFTPPGRA
jgi:FkbM family methyltransferase